MGLFFEDFRSNVAKVERRNTHFYKKSHKNLLSSKKLFIFAVDPVSLARARGSLTYWKRTFTNVIFRVSNLANLNLHLRERNRNVRVGCIVAYYNISRRGLTRVACPKREAMREPETWNKREVVTPTSFIYNLKQKQSHTWEVGWL